MKRNLLDSHSDAHYENEEWKYEIGKTHAIPLGVIQKVVLPGTPIDENHTQNGQTSKGINRFESMTCFVVGQIDILQFFCFVVKIFAYVEECGQQDQTKDRTQKWPCFVTTFHHVGHRAIVIEQIDSPSTLILQGQSILTQNTTLLITFLVDQLVFQCIKGRENDCFGRVEWKRTIVHQVRALVTKKQKKQQFDFGYPLKKPSPTL